MPDVYKITMVRMSIWTDEPAKERFCNMWISTGEPGNVHNLLQADSSMRKTQ